jgi:hypothetical protein
MTIYRHGTRGSSGDVPAGVVCIYFASVPLDAEGSDCRLYAERMSTPFIRYRRIARFAFLVTFALGNALAESPNDSQILGIYIQVNGFDIETVLLGQERRGHGPSGTTPDA